MHVQPDRPTITDEGRHNLAIHRLLEAAIRRGLELEEEEAETNSDAAGRLDGQTCGGEQMEANGNDPTQSYDTADI